MLGAYSDIVVNRDANATASEFVRSKIRQTVRDRSVAETLAPTSFPIATKRMCVDTNYYETFNRDNVTLVDVRANPLVAVTATGIQTTNATYSVDAIVFATGFDAMTGALRNIDVRGRDGTSLQQKWSEGPRTYLGLMTAGFPNLFTITGPGSPSVLANMVVAIEQHVDWIAECLAYMSEHQLATVAPTADAESAWVAHVSEVAHKTLFPQANSWYMGANVPGKPRVFMPYVGGFPAYNEKCREVVAKGYEGFAFAAAVP